MMIIMMTMAIIIMMVVIAIIINIIIILIHFMNQTFKFFLIMRIRRSHRFNFKRIATGRHDREAPFRTPVLSLSLTLC